MKKEIFLAYINPYVTAFLEEDAVKFYLDDKLGTNWKYVNKFSIPEEITAMGVGDEFWDGVGTIQLESIKNEGGTFVNALSTPLTYSFDVWKSVINNLEGCAAFYIDVPHEVYTKAGGTLDKEEFDATSMSMESIIDLVNDNHNKKVH